MVNLQQFPLLVWKNWVLFKRSTLWLIFEIIAPLALIIAFFFLTSKVESFDAGNEGKPVDITYETSRAFLTKKCTAKIGVVFAPTIQQVDTIYQKLLTVQARADPKIQFKRFLNKKELLKELTGQNVTLFNDDFCISYSGGIYFEHYDGSKLDFTVLIENSRLPPLNDQFGSSDYAFGEDVESNYIANGYIGLQAITISTYFEWRRLAPFKPNVRRLPVPPHNTGPFQAITYLPICLLPLIMHSVGLIVMEQFGGHRELLKIMGMKNSVFFASHFVFIWMKTFVVIFVALVLFMIRTSEFVSVLLILLTGLLYTLNVLLFVGICVAIIPFADAALMVSLAMTVVSVLLYWKPGPGPGVVWNMLLGLNFNYAYQSSIGIAVEHFERKRNLGFGEMFEKVGIENAFGIHFVMLLIDAIWMCGFMIGVDTLRQNFSLESLFFWRKKKIDMVGDLKLEELAQNHEKDPGRDNTPADIKLDNVVKIYKNGFLAVRKLDLSAHRDQVTCLLGHNGAGKSTAFNMITGIIQQTSGEVYVNKEERIGYCPQHNVLYDDMTVWEHLWLYVKLKGVTHNVKDELEHILVDLKFEEKRNVKASALSGGQKRKLSLGMALVGNPRVVLLDEPTAGMDVEARDFVTVFLEKYKVGRSILITTHYLDEAEELGDWIYIMFDGVVFTSGSVDYLIDRYGSGTILRFITQDGKSPEALASHVKQIAHQAVRTNVSSKVFERNVEISVPNSGSFNVWHANFVSLLNAVETNKHTLGFQTFGIERNSLESVFFRVGELAERLTGKKQDQLSNDPYVDVRRPWVIRPVFSFVALLAKRLIFTYNNIFMFLLFMSVPILLLALLMNKLASPGEGIAFTLDLLDGLKFVRGGMPSPFTNAEIDRYFGKRDLEKLTSSTQYRKFVENYRDHPRLGFAIHGDSAPYGVYNRFALHSMPVAVNTLADLMLKHDAGQAASVTSRVQGYMVAENNRVVGGLALSCVVPSLLLLHLLILTSYVIAETKCKFDHLQTLTPLSKAHLWFGNYVYDFILFLLLLIAFHIILSIANTYTGQFTIIYAISFLYFVCIASFVYGVSSFFNATTAASGVILISLIIITILAMLLYVFIGMKEHIYAPWSLMSPVFAYSGLLLILQVFNVDGTIWSYDNGGKFLVYMSVSTVVYFAAFVALRSPLRIWLTSKFMIYRGPVDPPLPPNEDIIAEENRVLNDPSNGAKDVEQSPEGDYVLKVIKISKGFPGKLALRSVTFGIKRGECFGLLGASGAGKTTAFDIITGLTYATTGTIQQEKDKDNGVKIGYCPQFDAIIDCLSGFQALVILACYYGYAHPFKKANQALELVGMKSMKHKKIAHCSGGQKRRISLAAALIANAPLTILDEPTAGVDVKCRRDLWDHLNLIRATKKATMMLTSHSMEECEALCSRIGILNKGEMVAIGSAQYLKSKYGGSFKLLIVLKHIIKRQAALDRVKATFPSAELLTISDTSVHLYWKVDKRDCEQWSLIWHKGSQVAISLDAKTFCVTQASLEEAFIQVINGATPNSDTTNTQNATLPPYNNGH